MIEWEEMIFAIMQNGVWWELWIEKIALCIIRFDPFLMFDTFLNKFNLKDIL